MRCADAIYSPQMTRNINAAKLRAFCLALPYFILPSKKQLPDWVNVFSTEAELAFIGLGVRINLRFPKSAAAFVLLKRSARNTRKSRLPK